MNFGSTIECSGCAAEHRMPDPTFPVGWATLRGFAFCPDCQSPAIINRVVKAAPRRRRAA